MRPSQKRFWAGKNKLKSAFGVIGTRVASEPSRSAFRGCGLFAISAISDTPNTRELPVASPLNC
jgi:hypothetical protein